MNRLFETVDAMNAFTVEELSLVESEKVIEDSTSELASEGSRLDDIAYELYRESDNDPDSIPTFEDTNDYIAGIDKKDYKKVYNKVKEAILNVQDCFYNGMIELSDNDTINSLDNPNGAIEQWDAIVKEKLEQFENETKAGVWQEGRQGRHIVVENDFYNAYNYKYLCDVLECLEQEAIDEFNNIGKKSESVNENQNTDERLAQGSEIVLNFSGSDKSREAYMDALNKLSALEWDNELTGDEYKEFNKQITDIYITNRNRSE